MWVVLLVVGTVLLIGAVAVGLAVTGRGRAVAPVAAAMLAVVCLVAALALRPRSGGAPDARPVLGAAPVGPVPSAAPGASLGATAVAAPADTVAPAMTCGDAGQALGPAERPYVSGPPAGPSLAATLPGDVQHLPYLITGLPGIAGNLSVSAAFQHVDTRGSVMVRTVGDALLDVNEVYYARDGDANYYFMIVDIATPKPGSCLTQLVYTTLTHQDPGTPFTVEPVQPGPRLAADHAVLGCGRTGQVYESNCAWAGSTASGEPFLGYFYGNLRLSDVDAARLSDSLFAAFTG